MFPLHTVHNHSLEKVNSNTLLGLAFEPSVQALEYLQPALRLYLSIVPKFDLGDIPDRFISLAFYPGVLELCFAYAEYDLQVCFILPLY